MSGGILIAPVIAPKKSKKQTPEEREAMIKALEDMDKPSEDQEEKRDAKADDGKDRKNAAVNRAQVAKKCS